MLKLQVPVVLNGMDFDSIDCELYFKNPVVIYNSDPASDIKCIGKTTGFVVNPEDKSIEVNIELEPGWLVSSDVVETSIGVQKWGKQSFSDENRWELMELIVVSGIKPDERNDD